MATLSRAITVGSDDATEAAGTVTIDGAALNANTSNGYMGFRFLNVTIPQGATINSATIDLYLTSGSYDDPYVEIKAENNSSPATYSTATNDISTRTLTTNYVIWDATGIGSGVKTTPNFAAVVKEVIDRGDWVNGSDLNIVIKGIDNTSLLRVAGYENAVNTPAVINIDYTDSTPMAIFANYYRGLME